MVVDDDQLEPLLGVGHEGVHRPFGQRLGAVGHDHDGDLGIATVAADQHHRRRARKRRTTARGELGPAHDLHVAHHGELGLEDRRVLPLRFLLLAKRLNLGTGLVVLLPQPRELER